MGLCADACTMQNAMAQRSTLEEGEGWRKAGNYEGGKS